MSTIARGARVTRTAQLAAAAALIFSASRAHAYAFSGMCDGSPVRDDRDSLAEFRMLCSFPNGTNSETQFARVVANWNANSRFPVTGHDNNTDCTFDLGNWHNEVGMRKRADLDQGMNSWTHYAHANVCFSDFSAGNYSEADTQIANDLDVTTQFLPDQAFSNSSSGGYAFAVMAHEVGHQLGLAHDNAHMNMMYGGPARMPGSPNGPTPYPDDAAGIAAIYGSNSSKNLFAAGQHWAAGQAFGQELTDNLAGANLAPCVNTTFSAVLTVANMGPIATYSQTVFLTRNDGSAPVASFTWVGSTTAAGRAGSFPFELSLAGVPPGTYFLGHLVDSASEIAESNEGDNLLVYSTPIVVTDCNGQLTWLSSAAHMLRND